MDKFKKDITDAFEGKTITKNLEPEVSLLNVKTQDDFNKIYEYIATRDLEFTTTTSLDINYSQSRGEVYRITIDKNINSTIEPFADKPNHKVFEELLKVNIPVMKKTRLEVQNFKELDIRFRLSEEKSMNASELIPILKLRSLNDKDINFRLKTRSSSTLYIAYGYRVRLDLTKVSTGKSIDEVMDPQAQLKFEAEIEIVFNRKQSKIPNEMINVFSEEISNILDTISEEIISPTHPSISKSSIETVIKDPNLEVSPTEWMLPNRVGFIQWFYKTFRYSDTTTNPANTSMPLFPSQRLVRDMMQFESPYRGLLLYHGLGVGKTCASISAAEGFLLNQRKIYVLLPASLTKNYQREIMQCASIGNPHSKHWNYIELESPLSEENKDVQSIINYYNIPFKFIKKSNGKIWITAIPEKLSKSRIIKINQSWQQMTEEDHSLANGFLNELMNVRFTFISYNGLTTAKVDEMQDDYFDDSFIVIDEAHNFISRSMAGKVGKRVYEKLMKAKNSKLVLLSGTPVINHPFELCKLLNLVRGPMKIYTLEFGNTQIDILSIETILKENGLYKFIDTLNIGSGKKLLFTLLPNNFIRKTDDEIDIIKHSQAWNRRTDDSIGRNILETLNKSFGKKFGNLNIEYSTALPTDKATFQTFFLDEQANPTNPMIQNENLFLRRILGLVSYYRTAGEEYFPTELPRIIRDIPLSDYQFNNYVEQRKVERKKDENQRKQRALNVSLFDKQSSVYRAFSRMSCNFVFPEKIHRPYPMDLRKAMKREIDEFAEDEPHEKPEQEEGVTVAVMRQYDQQIAKALTTLDKNKDKYLTKTQLMKYSSKFGSMIKDIEKSPGSCLLYSQFRTVEGLGVLKTVLEANGFVEIELSKEAGEWIIVNAENVMSSKYDGKRFVIFQEDRDKTEILMRIFNGQYDILPTRIREIIDDGNHSNLYGNLAKIMMISQSGAEGISLKNVRSVMITEPFWNMVRIDQVIGRAIRAKSHQDLPVEDRNVQVYLYASIFSKEQIKRKEQQVELDENLTSDQHIYMVANKKDKIIRQFLTMLKMAATDCLSHAHRNKLPTQKIKLDNKMMGMKCYSFPVNEPIEDLSYLNLWSEEKLKLGERPLEKIRQIQGRVVKKGNTKFVKVEGMNDLFDYDAYKNGNVLIKT